MAVGLKKREREREKLCQDLDMLYKYVCVCVCVCVQSSLLLRHRGKQITGIKRTPLYTFNLSQGGRRKEEEKEGCLHSLWTHI